MFKTRFISMLVLLAAVVTGAVAQTTYKVSVKEGTEDATNWTITPAEATTTGVAAGTTVTATYGGTKKVKSVKAVKKAPAATDLSTINANYIASDGETLTGTLASNVQISIADGATVTLNNVTINGVNDSNYEWAGITCLGDATIILSGTNTVKGFYENYPGIQAAAGRTLIINGTGSLTASSYDYAAAIGGGLSVACGNIEIQGGTITATSGGRAGIGGGNASCGDITISGGTVTATGGERGAGIGGGNNASCGDITISGGTVTATGGERGAGIGGGYNASWGNITISGGTVTATGGWRGAGIGGGARGTASFSCGNIIISGGTVNATGGDNAAGIGGGRGYNNNYKSSCGTITITTDVTKVTATKGSDAPNSIGAGNLGTCGTVTIGDNTGAISESPYTYDPSAPAPAPAATVTTAPTAKTGVKAGEDVAIVNEGTAEGGTMMYMVNATQPASTDGFSATVPTAEGLTAGTYYVWYYVKADDSHTDSEISATGIEVTIAAAAPAATVTTAPTAKGNLHAGLIIPLVTEGVADGGTMMYAVTTDNTQPASTDGFSATVPTAEGLTEACTRYVWYYVKADDTHTDSEISATGIEVTIAEPVEPTLANTLNTAGMTVKVNYNYNDEENYCLFLSNGNGTYTFQSGDGYAGGDGTCAKALVVEDGKLVFKQNFIDPIDEDWGDFGFSVTFDTSNNTYSEWKSETAAEEFNPSFISVEVNGATIAVTAAQ